MKTLLTSSVAEAAVIIRGGGLVAFPTETVYGLGADALNEAAVNKIFTAKQRPGDNPLIIHVASFEQLQTVTYEVTPNAKKFIDAFWPGPLTVVLKKAAGVPLAVTAGLETVAVRKPAGKLARDLIKLSGTPIAAPSANVSGRPSPTTWRSVQEDLDGRIECILQGEPTDIGLESTVVDCTSVPPMVLRSGSISIEQLRAVVPDTRAGVSDHDAAPRSPGQKHRHYSPKASVHLVAARETIAVGANSAFIGLTSPPRALAKTKICSSVNDYARNVFEFFRECDREGIGIIYCETVDEDGIGAALMDRLRRAAEA
ncbi:MAG TPA: L-threonylcarbamoyladenylate synthase [Pyrinomonadaceae bacterium]|nr:L-threonylcarbamoyladenylate synthase [Pyrinomonadaceae bacterium]